MGFVLIILIILAFAIKPYMEMTTFNKFSEDNLISSMIANFVKTKIRACHDGNDCNYYKINPKTILWELLTIV